MKKMKMVLLLAGVSLLTASSAFAVQCTGTSACQSVCNSKGGECLPPPVGGFSCNVCLTIDMPLEVFYSVDKKALLYTPTEEGYTVTLKQDSDNSDSLDNSSN
jgi:hypothetical protein